jgi:hypothetical protein
MPYEGTIPACFSVSLLDLTFGGGDRGVGEVMKSIEARSLMILVQIDEKCEFNRNAAESSKIGVTVGLSKHRPMRKLTALWYPTYGTRTHVGFASMEPRDKP